MTSSMTSSPGVTALLEEHAGLEARLADPDVHADAALAAARYLCADDRDLRRGDDWRTAVLAYSRSQAYVDRVRREAVGAATAVA